MAGVTRLQTRAERVKREAFAELRQLVLAYPEDVLPAQYRTELLKTLSRATMPDELEGLWPEGLT